MRSDVGGAIFWLFAGVAGVLGLASLALATLPVVGTWPLPTGFGGVTGDPLLEAVSAGRAFPGMEHWLPLFHEQMATVFDYLTDFRIADDHMLAEAAGERRAPPARRDVARNARSGVGV